MTVLLAPSTFFILLLGVSFVVVALWLYARKTNARLDQSIKLLNDLYLLNKTQADTLAEHASTLKNYQTSIEQLTANQGDLNILKTQHETLSKRFLALENQTQLLYQQDPELKMYSKAHQLVKEGVNIQDIMEATQLPRAEVEVLIGLQRHKPS